MILVDPVPSYADKDWDMNLDPQLTGQPRPEQQPHDQQKQPNPLPPNSAAQPSTNPTMRSNLRLFPPPLFSRQAVPLAYK